MVQNKFSNMIDVWLSTQRSSTLSFCWSAKVGVKRWRLMFALLSKWAKPVMKIVLFQLLKRRNQQTSLQGQQKRKSSSQQARQILRFLCENILLSLHLRCLISLFLLFRLHHNVVHFYQLQLVVVQRRSQRLETTRYLSEHSSLWADRFKAADRD